MGALAFGFPLDVIAPYDAYALAVVALASTLDYHRHMAESHARRLEQARQPELICPVSWPCLSARGRRSGGEDFIVAPCNEQALRFIERWPDWPTRAAAIWGPRDSGKTHLARIFADLSGARLVSASELSDVDPDTETAIAVELDETQADMDRDRLLFALFERPSGTLLLTGRTPPSEWPVVLGDLKSRFDALLAFEVWAPDDHLLSALIRKQFADRQLEITDAIVRRLLTACGAHPSGDRGFHRPHR